MSGIDSAWDDVNVVDMHEDLAWLARNESVWEGTKNFCLIGRDENGVFYAAAGCDHGFTRAQWQAARQQIGLDQPEVTEAEEEAWQEKERSLYGEIKEGLDDLVNHPPHYQSDNGIECIDAIRAALGLDGFVAHCRGTAIKYCWRSGKKEKHAEDLRKAAWYLNEAAEALESAK